MKLKKPSEQKVKDHLALTGGAIAGGAVSKGLFGLIHKPEATEATAIKKEENMGLIKRGALVAAGIGAGVYLDGNDLLTTLVRGVAIGVATVQGLEAVRVLAARGGVAPEATADSTAKKFLARTVGLGCPCDAPALNAPFVPRYETSHMDMEYYPTSGLGTPANALAEWGSVNLLAVS